MIRWILRRGARAFGTKYSYDTSYMTEVIDVSAGAGLRLSAFPLISQYRGPKAAHGVWVGAILASTLEGDCGQCVQLVTDMALDAGVKASTLRLCLEGDLDEAGDIGLGFRYAQAAISGDLSSDDLRLEIERMYGKKAVIAAAFAAASGRFYPVFKRGFGHGASCARLQVGGMPIAVGEAA